MSVHLAASRLKEDLRKKDPNAQVWVEAGNPDKIVVHTVSSVVDSYLGYTVKKSSTCQ